MCSPALTGRLRNSSLEFHVSQDSGSPRAEPLSRWRGISGTTKSSRARSLSWLKCAGFGMTDYPKFKLNQPEHRKPPCDDHHVTLDTPDFEACV